MKLVKGISVLSAAILLAACGGSSDSDDEPTALNTYDFPSKLISGDSSVSHSGQATRHALIGELKTLIGSDSFQDVGGDRQNALDKLNLIYEVGTDTVELVNLTNRNVHAGTDEPTPVSISLGTEGVVLDPIDYAEASSGKNLKGKVAGQDNPLSAGEFIGWDVVTVAGDNSKKGQGVNTAPDLLVQEWFGQLADLAVDADPKTKYVTAEGLDLQQLVQKFLLGSVTYSQAAEDYLRADKGLKKQNSAEDDVEKPYTSLEHQWDEGFGYFGAAHDYNLYTDAENSDQQDNDTNSDGVIDFYSEYSFGHSVNAAKRDKGSVDNAAATDFSKNAMDAFIAGRALIQANFGTDPLVEDVYQAYHAELVDISKVALANWEKAVAATVVHYINDVIADYALMGVSTDYSEEKLAKHWSEMKGFALGLQFSPASVSVISMADLKSIHADFTEAPVLTVDAKAAYVAQLNNARDTLQAAYAFDADNVANW